MVILELECKLLTHNQPSVYCVTLPLPFHMEVPLTNPLSHVWPFLVVCLSSAGTTPYVQAFDSLLAGPVAEYLKISKEIGGDVQKHVRRFGTFFRLKNWWLSSNSSHPWFKSPLRGPGCFCLHWGTQSMLWNSFSDFFPGPLLLSHALMGFFYIDSLLCSSW